MRIDDYHQNTGDKAYFNGHYYMEKSIGPSLLGLPFYITFKGLVRLPPLARLASGDRGPGALPTLDEVYRRYHLPVPGHPRSRPSPSLPRDGADVRDVLLGSGDVSHAWGRCLPAGRLVLRRTGNAVGLALAFGLGTPAFAYSNQMYQHQASAFGAFVGLFVLWRVREEGASKRWLWLVGALFGYAAASEYVLAPILTLIVLWAGLRVRPGRDSAAHCRRSRPMVHRDRRLQPRRIRNPHSQSDIGIRLFPAGSNPDSLASMLRPGSPSMGSRSALIEACSSYRPSCYFAPAGLYADVPP